MMGKSIKAEMVNVFKITHFKINHSAVPPHVLLLPLFCMAQFLFAVQLTVVTTQNS